MPSHERTPQERATLMFPNPEAASVFTEQVKTELQAQPQQGVDRSREIIGEAVAAQFAQAGEVAQTVKEPWVHTAEEHTEAQHLVDLAFAKDLPAAIAQARKSPHYPRNLDLLHDVLTNELYTLVQQAKLDRQPLSGYLLLIGLILLLTLLGVLVLLTTA